MNEELRAAPWQAVSERKRAAIQAFDPNGIGQTNGNLFGLPFDVSDSAVTIIPVPLDVTTSSRRGTSWGPAAMFAASPQIDLVDPVQPDAWKYGIGMLPIRQDRVDRNRELRAVAERCIAYLEQGGKSGDSADTRRLWQTVNRGCSQMLYGVIREAEALLEKSSLVGLVGGDHSAAFGLIRALARYFSSFGILHIDAHFDLRDAYQGFLLSHASIMRRAADISQVKRIAHVGVRDFSPAEFDFVAASNGRLVAFLDREMRHRLYDGAPWRDVADDITRVLPHNVYVSFDIDGLDPSLCPHTGTPVPGGLGFEEALWLVERVVASGRRIIGFDLCEVAPASNDPKSWAVDWDAIVGMRVLWRLGNLMIKSQR